MNNLDTIRKILCKSDKKLWELYSNGRWIGMAEGDTPYDAIRMAKRCLINRVKNNEFMQVKEYIPK